MTLQLDNLREGEELELAIRRHWIIYVILGFFTFIALLISLGLFMILGATFLSYMLNVSFWLCFSIFLYISWLNHELDLFLVTNNRIIGVDQTSFLNRTVSECNLGQVQEVNSTTSGLLANLLDYGTVTIQTAGNQTNLTMEFVPVSMQNARKILNIVDTYRDNQSHQNNLNNQLGKNSDSKIS